MLASSSPQNLRFFEVWGWKNLKIRGEDEALIFEVFAHPSSSSPQNYLVGHFDLSLWSKLSIVKHCKSLFSLFKKTKCILLAFRVKISLLGIKANFFIIIFFSFWNGVHFQIQCTLNHAQHHLVDFREKSLPISISFD